MEFSQYIRKPYPLRAAEITVDNIADVAELIGELKEDNKGPFILIDKKKVSNIVRARPGWYITNLDGNYRLYSPAVFKREFAERHPATGYFFDEGPEVQERDTLFEVPLDASPVFDQSAVEPVEDTDPTLANGIGRPPLTVYEDIQPANVFDAEEAREELGVPHLNAKPPHLL